MLLSHHKVEGDVTAQCAEEGGKVGGQIEVYRLGKTFNEYALRNVPMYKLSLHSEARRLHVG